MKLNAYRLLETIGSGRDGICYVAESTSESSPVELRVLQGEKGDPERWQRMTKRLQRAMLLDHPAALKIISLHLENDPPFVVVERCELPSADSWQFNAPLSHDEIIELAVLLSDMLLAAHRLGLALKNLGPESLLGPSPQEARIDFTGLDCGDFSKNADRADVASHDVLPAIGADQFATDSYRLGALLQYFVERAENPAAAIEFVSEKVSEAGRLIRQMMADDADERLSLRDAHDRFTALRRQFPTVTHEIAVDGLAPLHGGRDALTIAQTIRTMKAPPQVPNRLGRFRLLEKLGQGNMGAVYRAEDNSDGSTVAIKLIHHSARLKPSAVSRLHKEARLLAQVNNPYVANLLEVNEDAGIHYLVMEFVAGRDLGK